jgi:hypothetical protein
MSPEDPAAVGRRVAARGDQRAGWWPPQLGGSRTLCVPGLEGRVRRSTLFVARPSSLCDFVFPALWGTRPRCFFWGRFPKAPGPVPKAGCLILRRDAEQTGGAAARVPRVLAGRQWPCTFFVSCSIYLRTYLSICSWSLPCQRCLCWSLPFVCVCVYYCSNYEKAVRVGGGVCVCLLIILHWF